MNRGSAFRAIGALTLLVIVAVLAVVVVVPSNDAERAGVVPRFEVDALWPKPLPEAWVMGATVGVAVDSRDHVWVVHRPSTLTSGEVGLAQNPPIAEYCCKPAPPVLEFDQEGNLVSSWGGPGKGFDWPGSEHAVYVDHTDHVWIGSNDRTDGQIVKFTRSGEFVLQIGHPKVKPTSTSTIDLGAPANIEVDPSTNEVFVADGYSNRRIIVFDASTGMFKRMWGAYANRPVDGNPAAYDPNIAPTQFRNPVHCANLSNDGLVYVCDRTADRIQVFKKNGTFVKEAWVARKTLGAGSVWDIAFSPDPEQRFVYVADGTNARTHILLRESLDVVGHIGRGGRYPGQFYGVHSIATDSHGNIYTGETYEGKRLQRFVREP